MTQALVIVGDTATLTVDSVDGPHTLNHWVRVYFAVHVVGATGRTRTAKTQDLQRFVQFFEQALGHVHIDAWTPSLTKSFQRDLGETVSGRSGRVFKATTVNRVLATLRHFARWVHKQRPFASGSPFDGVRDIVIDAPAWHGLTQMQVTRLRGAIDTRLVGCQRKNQNPLLEAAMFYTLLHTGLRAHELCALDLAQYHHCGFHDVQRKGARVSKKVPVPAEARQHLDQYLAAHRGAEPGPLLLSRYNNRLTTKEIGRMCERIASQANAQVTDGSSLKLTPHMLRHTFLKRVADRYGVHAAQQMSGNVSIREVFRYTKPSDDETAEMSEKLW